MTRRAGPQHGYPVTRFDRLAPSIIGCAGTVEDRTISDLGVDLCGVCETRAGQTDELPGDTESLWWRTGSTLSKPFPKAPARDATLLLYDTLVLLFNEIDVNTVVKRARISNGPEMDRPKPDLIESTSTHLG